MRCPRCQFENMPGQSTCFRCNSVLENAEVAVEIHPPRAPRWRKPFRRVRYWFRRRTSLEKIEDAAGDLIDGGLTAFGIFRRPVVALPWREVRRITGLVLGGLILSIVPGLAQLVQRRFKAIWPYCLAWLALIAGALFMYGPGIGTALIGIAIVAHAWIAADGALLLQLTKRLPFYLLCMVALSLGVFGLYLGVHAVLLDDFAVGQAGLEVEYHQLRLRDHVLCRRLSDDGPQLRRGDMVLIGDVGAIGRHGIWDIGRTGETVCQLVGLPGDTVALKGGAFSVNGVARDPAEFAVPLWLRTDTFSIVLGKEECFVTMEYNATVRGAGRAGAIRQACVIPRGRLLARGFMRWLPLWRRGVLKEIE